MKKKQEVKQEESCGCCVLLSVIGVIAVVLLSAWGINRWVENAKKIKVGEIVYVDNSWSKLNTCVGITTGIYNYHGTAEILLLSKSCVDLNKGNDTLPVNQDDIKRLAD